MTSHRRAARGQPRPPPRPERLSPACSPGQAGQDDLLEDLRSANGTLVNGVRISEPVPSERGLVRIGDTGSPCGRTDAAGDARCRGPPRPSLPTALRGERVLRTPRPHPLVVGDAVRPGRAPWPEPPSPLAQRSRRAPGGGDPRARAGAGLRPPAAVRAATRPGCAVPFPPADARGGGRASSTFAGRAAPLELTPPTVAAARPSTATEWMAAARRRPRRATSSGAAAPGLGAGPCLSDQGADPAPHVEGGGDRGQGGEERAERARAGPGVRGAEEAGAGPEQPRLGAGGDRLRANITAARKAPRKPPPRAASAADVERLYREGKALYDGGNVGRRRPVRAPPRAGPEPPPVPPDAGDLRRPGGRHRPGRVPLPTVPRAGFGRRPGRAQGEEIP